MDIRGYLAVISRRGVLVAVLVAVAIAGSYTTRDRTVRYTASATIYVGSRQLQEGLSGDRATAVERASRTFALMIPSEAVAREAVRRSATNASPGSLAAATRASVVGGTSLILVSVVDHDPAAAQMLTNAVADAFVAKVQEFEPGAATAGDLPTLPAYVFQRAGLPVQPDSNGLFGRLLLAGVFAAVVGAAIALILEALDLRVRDAADLEARTGIAVLGVIPAHRLSGRPVNTRA